MQNYYELRYQKLIDSGISPSSAVEEIALIYLDARPLLKGKNATRAERDAAFWNSNFLTDLTVEAWKTEAMLLALTQYLGQKRVSNLGLLTHIAETAPETLQRAVRYSGLVLQKQSPRRAELDAIAISNPAAEELCKILDIFDFAYRSRVAEVDKWRQVFVALSPFELLAYASLYVFEKLVPQEFGLAMHSEETQPDIEKTWPAINETLAWKLSDCEEISLKLTNSAIGQSLAKHLSPFLFPSQEGQVARYELREAFERLMDAQVELDSYISQSADAYSYDHSIEFVRFGTHLEIVVVDKDARATWERDSRKLAVLHNYWFYRALEAFVDSGMASRPIGRPENQEANQLAYIKALRTKLRLMDVYGVGELVSTDSGETVPLFQALLSLELMSAFFHRDFLQNYVDHLRKTGDYAAALSAMAMQGLVDGMQIRFPLTWSDREAKIVNMLGWTVTAEHPQGSKRMAEAVVDFWTSDWSKLAVQIRDSSPGLMPKLFERPILKMGQMLVQLPWVVGLQNNSTAAINNLRRLGMRRGEVQMETRRIEKQLGALFELQGFQVAMNWNPPVEADGNAGEVDLICARDGVLFVLEVKSSYLRQSKQDAWLHASTTLRKAGRQLGRKVLAVKRVMAEQSELAESLGVKDGGSQMTVHGWIVDTSIECDHHRFDGFLKLSIEELLIALRDDRHLLHDPDGLHTGVIGVPAAVKGTLFPQGFSAAKLVKVIESQAVWAEI
jgi:Holliday junction resolvase-like predicted endonuclease